VQGKVMLLRRAERPSGLVGECGGAAWGEHHEARSKLVFEAGGWGASSEFQVERGSHAVRVWKGLQMSAYITCVTVDAVLRGRSK
jgi:hypothetical protein